MRHLALFFLFAVFIATFIKPFLEKQGFIFDFSDVSMEEDYIHIKDSTVYLPKILNGIHIQIDNVYVGFKERINIKGESIKVTINIGKVKREKEKKETKTAEKKQKGFDATPLVKLASLIDINLKDVYVSVNMGDVSNTLWIRDIHLREGKIWTDNFAWFVYRYKDYVHDLYVQVLSAEIDYPGVNIHEALVVSNMYRFKGEGRWEGYSGNFSAKGYISSINNDYVYIPDIEVIGHGFINFSDIHLEAESFAEYVHVKKRRFYENVKAYGHIHVKFGEYTKIEARLDTEGVKAEAVYTMTKEENILELNAEDIYIDNKIVGINHIFSTRGKLNMILYEKSKRLELQYRAKGVRFMKRIFTKGILDLKLDYKKDIKGMLYVNLGEITNIHFNGNFIGKTIEGYFHVKNFFLNTKHLKAVIDIKGRAGAGEGKYFVKANGHLNNIHIHNLETENIPFNINIVNENIEITIKDKSVEGFISIKNKKLRLNIDIKNKKIRFTNFELNPEYVNIKLEQNIKGYALFIKGKKINIFGNDFNINTDIDSSFTINETIFGNIKANIESLKIRNVDTGRWLLKGIVKREIVEISFSGGMGRGNVFYNMDTERFFANANLNYVFKDLITSIGVKAEGNRNNFSLNIDGYTRFKDIKLPLKGHLRYSKGVIKGNIESSKYEGKYLSIFFGGININGNSNQIIIKNGGASFKLFGENIASIESGKIYINPKKGTMHAKRTSISGIINGFIEVKIQKDFLIKSEGWINLDAISENLTSISMTRLSGKLNYSIYRKNENINVIVKNKQPIVVLSKFVAVPLNSFVDIKYQNNEINGYVSFSEETTNTLIGIKGSKDHISISADIRNLPIRYISENIEYFGILDGKGTTKYNYENVNIVFDGFVSGIARLREFDEKERKEKEKPKWLKKINVDIYVKTKDTLRVQLPEGYVYTDVGTLITNNLYDPYYFVNINLTSGELRYFGRKFLINKGYINVEKERAKDDIYIDISIFNPNPDYNIIIDMKGNIESPNIIVRSEPPRDEKEILSRLILGGEVEGVLPAASTLISRFPQLTTILSNTAGVIGTDINIEVRPQTSVAGNIGLGIRISKEFSKRIYIEYQSSNVQDPRATYFGGEIRILPSTSLGGKTYSDRTREFNIRLRKKFDF